MPDEMPLGFSVPIVCKPLMADLNLIRLFDFYLAAMLLLSIYRRRVVYLDGIRLVFSTLFQRKKLIGTLSENKGVLLTAEVLRPIVIVLCLVIVQLVCSRVLWPHANLLLGDVFDSWWQMLTVLVAFIPMFGVDLYFLICVGKFDRRETEKYLDQAETWLGSWRGTMVRVATLGYVNPSRIVKEQVRAGLKELGSTVSWAMNWVAIQSCCRIAFGLAVWGLWVMS